MSLMKASRVGQVIAIVVVGLLAGAALIALLNRQYIVDQLTVWQYQPSADVVAVAERSTMSERGKFYFYASQPVIEGTQVFNDQCGRREPGTAILGCYTGGFIYIYDVKDPRLDGIREVTAAHEMLHAVYERLSDGERSRIDRLVEAEYQSMKDNQELAERLEFYDRTQPGERLNELHSIIATEKRSVSAELEAWYGQYFTNRGFVVELHDKYEAIFIELRERADELSAELESLGRQIETETASYNNDVRALNADIAAFNARAAAGEFDSQAQFASERNALASRSSTLDQLRAKINNDVTLYESKRAELESIASQSEALNRTIDSSLAPTPSF